MKRKFFLIFLGFVASALMLLTAELVICLACPGISYLGVDESLFSKSDEEIGHEWQLRVERPELWKPQDALREYLHSQSISCRDGRSWFDLSRAKPREYYLFGDPLHFTARGHETVYRYWCTLKSADE